MIKIDNNNIKYTSYFKGDLKSPEGKLIPFDKFVKVQKANIGVNLCGIKVIDVVVQNDECWIYWICTDKRLQKELKDGKEIKMNINSR